MESLALGHVTFRNFIFKLIGYFIKAINVKIHSHTQTIEHLELDLFSPRPQSEGWWNLVGKFQRFSFPHAMATLAVWVTVGFASTMVRVSVPLGDVLFWLSPVVYIAAFAFGVLFKAQAGSTVPGKWGINLIKGFGLVFVFLTYLSVFLFLLVPVLIATFVILILLVLSIFFMPWITIPLLLRDLRALWRFLFGGKSDNAWQHGTARFANQQDLQEAGLLKPQGLLLGCHQGQPIRTEGEGNILTVAPAGAGKGVGVVIPNLLEYPGSMVVIDPKGENYAITAWARTQLGQRVFRLDPFEVCGSGTHSLNPLAGLHPNHPDLVDEAASIADMLIVPNPNDRDPFWNETAKKVLRTYILGVICLMPPDVRDLVQVLRMLTLATDDRNALLGIMQNSPACNGVLARGAVEILSLTDRMRADLYAVVLQHLDFLNSPRVEAALSRTDFRPEELKEMGNVTVYLILPADKLAAYSRLLRLWINCFLNAQIRSRAPGTRRVVFLLDEMAQLGPMEPLVRAVSLLRGYGMTLWMVLQDLSQLRGLYPEKWETFVSNANIQQYFGVADFQTAEYVSKLLGQSTISVVSTSSGQTNGANRSWSGSTLGGGSGQSGYSDSRNASSTVSQTARPLMLPDEVRRLSNNVALIFKQGVLPIAAERPNYLAMPAYRGRYAENPMHRRQ